MCIYIKINFCCVSKNAWSFRIFYFFLTTWNIQSFLQDSKKIRLYRIRINWGSIKRDLSILILLLSQENNQISDIFSFVIITSEKFNINFLRSRVPFNFFYNFIRNFTLRAEKRTQIHSRVNFSSEGIWNTTDDFSLAFFHQLFRCTKIQQNFRKLSGMKQATRRVSCSGSFQMEFEQQARAKYTLSRNTFHNAI